LAAARAAVRDQADADGGDQPEVSDMWLGASVGAGGHGQPKLVVMADGVGPLGQKSGPAGTFKHGFKFGADVLPEHGMGTVYRASADFEAMSGQSVRFGVLHGSPVLQIKSGILDLRQKFPICMSAGLSEKSALFVTKS